MCFVLRVKLSKDVGRGLCRSTGYHRGAGRYDLLRCRFAVPARPNWCNSRPQLNDPMAAAETDWRLPRSTGEARGRVLFVLVRCSTEREWPLTDFPAGFGLTTRSSVKADLFTVQKTCRSCSRRSHPWAALARSQRTTQIRITRTSPWPLWRYTTSGTCSLG